MQGNGMMGVRWWLAAVAVFAGGLLRAQGVMDVTQDEYQDKLFPVREYTVTVISEVNNHLSTSKQFRSGWKWRTEPVPSAKGFVLLNIDERGVEYYGHPSKKTYAKKSRVINLCTGDGMQDIKLEELGKEEVDGVLCDKYRVTTSSYLTSVLLFWTSPRARNMPVKLEEATATDFCTYKFKDYIFAKPPEDVFVIPRGYKHDNAWQTELNALWMKQKQAKRDAEKSYQPPQGVAATVSAKDNPLRIRKWKYDQEAQKAVFEFEVVSEDADVFALRPLALKQIQKVCNDEYAQTNPNSAKGMLGFTLVSELDMPKLTVDVTVHRIRPMSHSYNSATRIGTLKVNLGKSGDANYAGAYKWALDNIGVICSSKEVGMEAGQPPPEGARYGILSEKTTDDGMLEITFEVFQ